MSFRMQISPLVSNSMALALHSIEGFALAMMCQNRTQSRKLAISILKEVEILFILQIFRFCYYNRGSVNFLLR